MNEPFVPTPQTIEVGEVGRLTDTELAALGTDELGRLKVALGRASRAVKGQLAAADRRRQAGIRPDWAWFRSAQNAKAMYGHQIKLIEAEYTRRKGGSKADRNVALQREFVSLAKEKLSPEVFQMWLDETIRRLKAKGEREDVDVDQRGDARLRRIAHENYVRMLRSVEDETSHHGSEPR